MSSEPIIFTKRICVLRGASAVGKKEFEGPYGDRFDLHSDDNTFGRDTWEKAESEMQRLAFNLLLTKTGLRDRDVDLLFAGDLQNQCTGSAYGLRDFDIPYMGLYGACSTMAEGIGLAGISLESGSCKKVGVIASSHFCSAERQYRFPLEYGAQRTPSAQWTVTGAGAVMLCAAGTGVQLVGFCPGRVVDPGITDANQMGAAMAPAAVDTLCRFFQQTDTKPCDYDAIFTGDLGKIGQEIVLEQMRNRGYEMASNYNDCGLLIYANERQDTHSGGSGCGCSATIFASVILPRLESGEYKNAILVGTGAMMSPSALLQGESIPGIAHLVCFEAPERRES